MKKIMAFFLSLVLLLTSFVRVLSVSAETSLTPGKVTLNLREIFAADKKGEFEKANDGYIGIPVVLTTFVRDSATFNKATILYVVGANIERVGTDTDEAIINDLLDEGYAVTVIDYLGNPLATGTPLSYSLMTIQSGDVNSNKYTCGYTIDYMYSYCLPAGCRIVRDIYFYSLDTMALNGTNEYIVWLWNNYYAGENGVYKDANGNDLPYAETIDDCIKKDGSPMYFDLDMDIIYPANPKEDAVVPVMAHASNCETRVRHISRNDSSTVYHIQGLIEGYASIVYDHEYIPMSRNDHYGYYGNYSLQYSSFTLGYTNANAVHSAAIRRIKYLADTYGYDAEYIGVTGFSKSALGPGILADTTHEQRGEIKNFGEFCPEGADPDAYMGEQPWLTYPDGTPISSNVTTVYSGAGAGVCNYGMINVNENCVPFASTIGTEDTTGGFRTYIDKVHGYFDNTDIESLYYNPVGLAHFVAWGYNNEFQRENVDIVWSFLDNHIRAAYREEAPEVLYMTPKSGVLYDEPQEVMLKFSRAMDLESVEENVKVISLSTGKELKGTWTTQHGKTTLYFNSSQMIHGDSYKVIVPVGTKAADGVPTDMDFIKTFVVSGDVKIQASADTYVSSLKADSNFGTAENMVVSYTDEGEEIGLVSFKRDVGFTDTSQASLVIDKTNMTTGPVSIYAKNGTFDENAVTYGDINKDEYTYLGTAGGDGSLVYADVSEFIENNNSSDVTFMITSPSKQGETYSRNFDNDNDTTFAKNTHYVYGAGNATMSFVDGTIYLTNRSSGNRLKFIDGLGKSSLEQSDIGIVYKITAKVKADADASILVGLYAQTGEIGYNPYGDKTYTVKAGEWTTLEHYVTITQQMIDINTDCVTFVPQGTVNYAIDEISVEVTECGGIFAAKESSDELTAPATLVLWTPEKSDVTADLAVIGSGKDKNTVLNEEYTVNADGEDDYSETKKAYVKVPLTQFDFTAETVNFEFNLESSVNNEISIYGLIDDDTEFARNFDGNITWNTAYASNGNGVEKSKVYGGAPIASVSAYTSKISVDVKDYVTYMKDKGYTAVTFMLVAEECGTIKTVDFEGVAYYDKVVKSDGLKNYNHTIMVDPTDADNSAFYFDKSGSQSTGYHQTLAFTQLIDEDDLFTSEDIGSTITVTFRQYNVVSSEYADCFDFGKIGKAGTATASLANLSYVTKTTTYQGNTVSGATTPMNQWYDVKYVINVTEDAVTNYADHNSIVIATGWTASGVYIDDISVTKKVGDVVITSAQDFAPVALTDFENTDSFNNYSALNMTGYEIAVKADPTADDNKVLYIDKLAGNGGYAQNIALTGLIKKDGVFTEEDIGNVYTITFRQYNVVTSDEYLEIGCMDFGQIAAPGTATGNLKKWTSGYSKTISQNGVTASVNAPMNQWYDVTYVIEVTDEVVTTYSTSTAIVLAIGYTGDAIYIDDINIDVKYGEKENTLGFVPLTTFNGDESFENAVANERLAKLNYNSGITNDPTDSTNDVYFFDKSGRIDGKNAYLECMSITGLIKTDNQFTEDDIGKVYTVKYRQYNVVPEGVADCKDFSVIGVAGTTGGTTNAHYIQPGFVKKTTTYQGNTVAGANIPMNQWYDVAFTFTVTEDVVNTYSNYTAILIGCGMDATRCYIDNIRVSVEGVTPEQSALPGIVYDGLFKEDMTAAAVIDAAAPDKNGRAGETLTLHRTDKITSDGLRKVYATFDKYRLNHIQSAAITVTVANPKAGNTLYLYGLNSSVETEGLTWNSAWGNDIENNGIISANTYGEAPIAEIVITDEVTYTVDVTEYIKSVETNDKFTVVLTGVTGDGATEISDVSAYLQSRAYDNSESVAVMLSPESGDILSGKVTIAAHSSNSVEKTVEKTDFYINGELYEGYVQYTGDVSYSEFTLADGEYSVYVVYSYSDGTTAVSDTVTFTVGKLYGLIDVNSDGTEDASFFAVGAAENEKTYKVEFDYAATAATTEEAPCFGFFTAAADLSNIAYIGGANSVIYTAPTDLEAAQSYHATVIVTADMIDGASNLYGYVIGNTDGVKVYNIKVAALDKVVVNGGVSVLTDEVEQTTNKQGLRFYFNYTTTNGGSDLVIGDTTYTVVERGFLFRNGNQGNVVFDGNNYKGSASVVTHSTKNFEKCWKLEGQTVTFSTKITGFVDGAAENANYDDSLFVKGYVVIQDADGNQFTVYGKASNYSVNSAKALY